MSELTLPAALQRPRYRNLATVAFYAVVCLVWSWPQATGAGVMVSRHFDIFGSLWAGGVGPHLLDGVVTPLSGWPEGLDLRRADSLVLLLLSFFLGRFMSGATLLALVTLVGPVVSAWAAERFAARVLGAQWPWSLIAGLTYAFSGVAATALLEGHPYVLLNPWLPLMAWQWHRCTGPEAHPRHGVLTGVFWLLCLLTSAYTGLAATLWLAAAALRPVLNRRSRLLWRLPVAVALALILVGGGLYTAAFVSGGTGQRAIDEFRDMPNKGTLRAGSANLADMAGVTVAADTESHSMVPALGFLPLVLAALAFRLRPSGPWLLCLALGLIALAVALGPMLRGSAFSDGVPWVLSPLIKLKLATFFRFPVRLVFVAALALGAVAAAVAARLARGNRWAVVLLPLALFDLYICTGMPGRAGRWPLELPGAYASLPKSGALLHLIPELHGGSKRMETFLSTLDCAHQHAHGRPLLARCLGGDHRSGPRFKVGSWLRTALRGGGEPAEIRIQLAALGIGAVAWRPDLFVPADRAALRLGLTGSLGPPLAASSNGGDNVEVFGVRNPAGRIAARMSWKKFLASRAPAKKRSAAR